MKERVQFCYAMTRNLRGFPKEYLKKKNKDNESYLSEYFPGATIETREYIPT